MPDARARGRGYGASARLALDGDETGGEVPRLVAQVVAESCVSCHGSSGEEPRLEGDGDLLKHRSAMVKEVLGKSMPPSAPLSTKQIEAFRLWKAGDDDGDGGAPQTPKTSKTPPADEGR